MPGHALGAENSLDATSGTWLASHFHVGQNYGQGQIWKHYYLYALERTGRLSGVRFFGQNDWYRHLAADTVARQASDGSWGDTVDTSFALLFLARGRHPILMNKVRFTGFWVNKWYDAATPGQRAETFAPLFEMAKRGLLRTKVEATYSLDESQAAIAHAMQSKRGGKIVFTL